MRDFGERRWGGPEGARVHVFALVGDEVARLVDEVYAPVLAQWTHLLRIVPTDRLHLTLAWLPAPVAAEVSEDQHRALDHAVQRALVGSTSARIACGPALVTSHGVRLDVTPDSEINQLSALMHRALREVFGPDVVPDPEPAALTPHIALAYGTADTPAEDDIALAEQLREARVPGLGPGWPRYRPTRALMTVRAVTVLDGDTFAADPWQWSGARTIGLRQPWLTDPADPRVVADRADTAQYQDVVARFLAGWRADIDIVHGLDEPDGRPSTRVAPQLGPALTAAARRALAAQQGYIQDRDDRADDLTGRITHTTYQEAQAAVAVLAAAVGAAFPDLARHEAGWLAAGLTGARP